MTDIFRSLLYSHNLYFDYFDSSNSVISELRSQILNGNLFDDSIAVYAVGSLGRKELTQTSDFDLYGLSGETFYLTNTKQQMSLLSDVVDETFKSKYNVDKKCIEIFSPKKLTEAIGTGADDYQNTFTARMTLLLEGRWLCNKQLFNISVEEVLNGYFVGRSFRDGKLPVVFLLDDIFRFWKTLCVNYEVSFYNGSRPMALKKISLRFSRALEVFATIISLVVCNPKSSSECDHLIKMTPIERLASALDEIGSREYLIGFQDILDLYKEFLDLKSINHDGMLEKNDSLQRKFEIKGDRFTDFLFSVLSFASEKSPLKKLLLM